MPFCCYINIQEYYGTHIFHCRHMRRLRYACHAAIGLARYWRFRRLIFAWLFRHAVASVTCAAAFIMPRRRASYAIS